MKFAKIAILLFALLALAACGGSKSTSSGSGSGGTPPPVNKAPTANAGSDQNLSIKADGTALDGSQSNDPDNDVLRYSWSVTSKPNGTIASIDQATSAKPKLRALAPGDYTITLRVTDPSNASATDMVKVTLTNDAPVIVQTVSSSKPAIGAKVTLDASGSTDQNGHQLTYKWTVTQSPANSAIPFEFNTPSPIIQFDENGEYVFQLEISDGYATIQETLDPIVVSEFSITNLATPFRHVGFHSSSEKTITISGKTAAILNANGSEEFTIELPQTGIGVTIAPNGQKAAVFHLRAVSYIEMTTGILLATHSVNVDVGDIVLDDNNIAHIFPSTGQFIPVLSLNLETGGTSNSARQVRHRTRVKIHPSGTKIYGANNGLSPSDLERYSIVNNTVTVDYDSPYHGDYPFNGNLWISMDGNSILSKSGVVVRATDDRQTDLTFKMTLGGAFGNILHASYSPFDQNWYVIDDLAGQGATTIKAYSGDNGDLIGKIDLPFVNGNSGDQMIAKFVFTNETAGTVKILAQDHLTNPQNFVLIERRLVDASSLDFPPKVVAQKYSAGVVGANVSLNASQSFDPEGQIITYEWELVSEPTMSAITPVGLTDDTLTFTPLIAGAYVFKLSVDDGGKQSMPKNITVNVVEENSPLIYRIEGDITDAEYSKSLDSLVYLLEDQSILRIVNFSDFSETDIKLERKGLRVGISPDGLFAAVSHPGLVTLVNLDSKSVIDTQEYSADWGDIALDKNNRAHLIPNRDQFVNFLSFDFAANSVTGFIFSARANTQIRMHPNGNWIYAANVGVSPSGFEKWDVSTTPTIYTGRAPDHGTYPINGDIWISEDGDQLMVASAHFFHSSDDPSVDMTFLDKIGDGLSVKWADHSSETNEWATLIGNNNKVSFYEDATFTLNGTLDIVNIPTATGSSPTFGTKVFQSDTGSSAIVLTDNQVLMDKYAVQISSR